MSNFYNFSKILIESYGWSQTGIQRNENQDAFLSCPKNNIWVVADGVNKSCLAGKASALITNSLSQLSHPMTLEQHINNTILNLQSSNYYLRQRAVRSGKINASTFVALLIHDNLGACLWAGDSRCYLFRDGILYQLTKDHTLRQYKIDSGEMTDLEARHVIGNNLITNAIGAYDNLRLEIIKFPIFHKDIFILCSDGLFKCITPKSILYFLEKNTLKETVNELITVINDLTPPDDTTFIAIKI